MTRELIFSGLNRLQGALARTHLVAGHASSGGGGGGGHEGPQPIMSLCRLHLHYLSVLEKFHSSSTYPGPQISGFVAGGVPRFATGDERHPMPPPS